MALWAAAHLSSEGARLADEMYEDEYFLGVRLRNLLQGLGRHWKHTDAERLALARALVKHDHVLAALIAARCFEGTVYRIAAEFGLSTPLGKKGQTEFSALVDGLSRRRELADFGVSPEELRCLRSHRNDAIHGRPPISGRDARKLVDETQRLYQGFERWLSARVKG